MFGDIMSGIASVINTGIGINEAVNENSITNRQAQQALDDSRTIAENNLNFQKDNLAYQKELQQQVFDREDSSYQRTAEDMQKAGLNPLMMSGTNGAGSVINTQAPQQSEAPAQMKMQKSQLALQATTQVMNTLKDMSNTMQGIEQSSLARKQLSESQLTELDKLYRSLSKCSPGSQQYKDIYAQISKIVLPDSVGSLIALVARSCGLDYSDIAQVVTDFIKPSDFVNNDNTQSSSTLPSSLADVKDDRSLFQVVNDSVKADSSLADNPIISGTAHVIDSSEKTPDLSKQTADSAKAKSKINIDYNKASSLMFAKATSDDWDKYNAYKASLKGSTAEKTAQAKLWLIDYVSSKGWL